MPRGRRGGGWWGAEEEQSTPVEACREGDGCEEEGCEEEGCEEEGCEEEGRREGGWGRSKGRGLFECRWKHQAPEKRLSGRFHFHSRLTSSNCGWPGGSLAG